MSKKALCIGINDYPGTANDLKGCVNDASDWAAELGRRGFTVTKLLDAQATKAGMVGAIRNLIGAAGDGDTVVITYSGHGTWVPDSSGDESDGRDEALVPYDISSSGPLIDDEIQRLFGAAAAGVRILMIADSCNSGSVTRGREDDMDTGKTRARFMPLSDWMPKDQLPAAGGAAPRVVSGLKRVGGDLLLAGCMDAERSMDSSFQGRPNGAFTYYALKTLRERKPANYDAWFNAIREYLPNARLAQTPQILGSATARRFAVFE